MALVDMYDSIAQDWIESNFYSSLFEVSPLLATLVGANRVGNEDIKVQDFSIIGGRPSGLSPERRQELRGSTKWEPPVNTAKFGGGTKVGYRGSTGNVTTVDIAGAPDFRWTLFDQPIKVMKDDLDAAQGDFRVVELLQEAVSVGMGELEDDVSTSLYSGNPTSQTAKTWDDLCGLRLLTNNGVTFSTYGNVVKTTDTFFKPGFYSETVSNFDWNLIDNMNKGGGTSANPNGGPATLGTGLDLVVCNEDLFYTSVLPKARADGHQVIQEADMPMVGKIGFKVPMVRYMNTVVMYDPHCPAGLVSGRSYLYGLTLKELRLMIHPDYDFKVMPFTDQEPITKERSFTSSIQLKCIFGTPKPALFGVYTDVN